MFRLFKRANKEEISSTLIGQSQTFEPSFHTLQYSTFMDKDEKKNLHTKLAMVDIGKD
jgi:hypothetical protein